MASCQKSARRGRKAARGHQQTVGGQRMLPSHSADTRRALVFEQAFRLPRSGFVPVTRPISLRWRETILACPRGCSALLGSALTQSVAVLNVQAIARSHRLVWPIGRRRQQTYTESSATWALDLSGQGYESSPGPRRTSGRARTHCRRRRFQASRTRRRAGCRTGSWRKRTNSRDGRYFSAGRRRLCA